MYSSYVSLLCIIAIIAMYHGYNISPYIIAM